MKNTFIPKFTYIIPFRYQPDRIIPLKRAIEWISGFGGIEIIVVEQDKNSFISNLSFKGQHIFLESEFPFNKAWAYNVAIRRASSNILIFADSDFVMNPNDLIESMKLLEFVDCVIPTSNIIKLDPNESSFDLMSIFNIKRLGPKLNLADGISIFKKEAIEKIGGWNEDILGPGFVNRFQDLKIRRLLSVKEANFTGYHFHHQPEKYDSQLSQRNNQILEHYSNPSNDLQGHINNTIGRTGLLNKYQI